MSDHIDEFTSAYIEAALWSSTDESTPSGGYPLDRNYSIANVDPDTLAQMIEDCRDFQANNEIPEYEHREYSDAEMAGHDFWLTRNGHGAGFWDRDLGEIGDRLSDAARAYGEFNLYVGDDKMIHGG